jgi:hypothetical protein
MLSATSASKPTAPDLIHNSEFPISGPCPLPPEVMEANRRHAELLLSGQIKTDYKHDPENSLFAKICAMEFNYPQPNAQPNQQPNPNH